MNEPPSDKFALTLLDFLKGRKPLSSMSSFRGGLCSWCFDPLPLEWDPDPGTE
jgi:hypothetical protein